MPPRHFQSLWLRIAIPFLLFVAAGSLALVAWLHLSAVRESRSLFAALARTNAEFIRSARLAASERTSESLSRVLGMEVYLWPHRDARFSEMMRGAAAGKMDAMIEAHRVPGEVRARGGFEAVAVGVSEEIELLLVRASEAAFIFQPQTAGVLGAFWGLSLALAWTLARGVVHPLRLLARRLPHIEDDMEATLPGAERADEIGQLARAYLGTRAQLAEERLRREQAERLAILGRMVTGLAHEIHNPLSAIRMHAQLLESALPGHLEETAADSIPVLLDETMRIEGLVNQWMFLARPMPPRMAVGDLCQIVKEMVRAHGGTAAHAGVKLVNDLPAGVQVRVDARRLAQAIGNVLLNAIQAMPMGGLLTISVTNDEGGVRLTFRDSGPGFSEAALAHHADLFFSEKEGGMGIGLNVCAEILKAHGGALRVGNRSEGGGEVILALPASPLFP
ncbi:MAG: Integral rane sensor signal transduction histidine kinase [Chthoniobacteraceae bacterium]|nr:Integral rane sensor signal transduction histidine kinase [Chthoniobacteraceae bacterium]